MINSTQDILYLVISFCVLWATFFLCWTFYYFMRLLRNANHIVEEFRSRIQILTDTINHVRNKVEMISSMMTVLSEGVVGFVKKAATKKAEDWLEDKEEKFNFAAREAVGKAVQETARKLHRTAKKVRN